MWAVFADTVLAIDRLHLDGHIRDWSLLHYPPKSEHVLVLQQLVAVPSRFFPYFDARGQINEGPV